MATNDDIMNVNIWIHIFISEIFKGFLYPLCLNDEPSYEDINSHMTSV